MKIFIVYESRYHGLSSLLRDHTYTQQVMGEITWFMSLMKYLQTKNNVKVEHCSDINHFVVCLKKYQIDNPYLIMDYCTIPETTWNNISKVLMNLDNTYGMCYWGKDENGVMRLGNIDGKTIPIENVLTPFDYSNKNSFLGYNLDILCHQINNIKYNREYGILWGKDIAEINIEMVSHLCKMGIGFYSTSKTSLGIPGIINLGIIPKKEWYLLLDNCKFILGGGNPKNGPTILEALYYKTPLFCPSEQVSKSCQESENIYFIDNMDITEIYDKIVAVNFKDDIKTKSLINADSYKERVDNIFGL
jgi:hypothetical protein